MQHRNAKIFSILLPLFALFLLGFSKGTAAATAKKNILFIALPAFVASNHSTPTTPNIWKTHTDITRWEGTKTCLQCHRKEAEEVFSSVHYQWLGTTPYMDNGPQVQGKLDVGVNSYCINITGNWNGCGACHVGLGARPEPTVSTAQLENIDCLICHQKKYKRKKVDNRFVPDTDKMTISMVTAAQTVHEPNRWTCLQCHAKGGGGDNYKRGDMALAHSATTDRQFDVHMATTGADLSCQECHLTDKHRMAGKGSDLRPTDLAQPMSCSTCHQDKGSSQGHDNEDINRHLTKVACQSCHIGTYARNASDTGANEQTEIHRDWRQPHPTASGAIHPTPTMAGNLIPIYRWWNGNSTSYLLYDQIMVDSTTGRIPTSRPSGSVAEAGAKLFPFKYKSATQPLASDRNQLIALDTSVYFSIGDAIAATQSGLSNMGYSASEPYTWVETDTFQLITHQVMPKENALSCGDCHGSSQRMDFTGTLGYQLKGSRQTVCMQCHGQEDGEDGPEYRWIHEKHVEDKKYDCSWCHTFSRPERNLKGALKN